MELLYTKLVYIDSLHSFFLINENQKYKSNNNLYSIAGSENLASTNENKSSSPLFTTTTLNISNVSNVSIMDKLTLKLVEKYLRKRMNILNKDSNDEIMKNRYLQLNAKKLVVIKYFFNLAFFTISLKYIDIFYRVKFGGKYSHFKSLNIKKNSFTLLEYY